MAIVYIPHLPDTKGEGFNFEEAEKYGKVKTLLEGRQQVFNFKLMEDLLQQGLAPYTENDYLILSGHKLIVAMAITRILARFGKVNLLVYSDRFSQFTPYALNGEIPLRGNHHA